MNDTSWHVLSHSCVNESDKSCLTCLQHTATHCNTLQHTCLQHTATHCNTQTMKQVLTHTLKDMSTHEWDTLKDMSTHEWHVVTRLVSFMCECVLSGLVSFMCEWLVTTCVGLTHWKTWAHTQNYSALVIWKEHILCNTLQHTATHCNILQHCTTLQQRTATSLKYAHTNRFCAGDVEAQYVDTQ